MSRVLFGVYISKCITILPGFEPQYVESVCKFVKRLGLGTYFNFVMHHLTIITNF